MVEVVHAGRSVNMALENMSSRLFKREDIRLDSTKRYEEYEEEELNNQLVGTGLKARSHHKLVETMRAPRKARQASTTTEPNADRPEPRSSMRLARRVTVGEQDDSRNPRELPYYMGAVEQGYAGRGEGRPQYGLED